MLEEYLENNSYYVASIDGNRCSNLESFLDEIAISFDFASHFGRNMNALNDCINDLDWIPKDNYILIINNFKDFFKNDLDNKDDIIKFLEEVSNEWDNVPNYEGEDEYRKKSDFKIIYN